MRRPPMAMTEAAPQRPGLTFSLASTPRITYGLFTRAAAETAGESKNAHRERRHYEGVVVSQPVNAGCYLTGYDCVLLARLLAPAVRELGRGPHLDELRPALDAIGAAAEVQRATDASRLRSPVSSTDGWLKTREYARLRGVSEQAVRKRIAQGTLCAERRGRAWVVDPSNQQ
jgi:hypothetical protein